MNSIVQKIAQKPFRVLITLIILTFIFLFSISKNARIETNLDEYMPSNHPAFIFSDEMEEYFGIHDNILIAIEHPQSIFNNETLAKIRSISTELPMRFEGIDIDDITSLYTAENITTDEWGLTVEAFYTDQSLSEEKIAEIQKAVESNEMIHGRVVSHDSRSTLIIAQLEEGVFTDLFYKELQLFAAEFENPENIYIAGRPVVEGELTKLGPQDMVRMAPLVIIIITIIMLLLLRSLRSTIINLIIVLSGTLTAFGLMSLFKVPIYTVSTMIPVMLIAIGGADGIHMHNTIQHIVQKNPNITKDKLVQQTLKEMVRPVTMTSITTAVGFLSLTTSQVLPVRYFGLFTASGVMMEMFIALILFPASIYLFGVPKVKNAKVSSFSKGSKENNGSKQEKDNMSSRFGTKLLKNPRLVILIAVIIIVLASFGAARVWIDTSFLANFRKDSSIVQTDRFVNEHFGGTSTLNVILSSEEDDIFKNPDVLEIIDDLQKKIEDHPIAGDSFAITDYIRRMHQVMHDNDPAYNRIPETRNMIAQYLLLYEMSGDPENLDRVVDYEYKNANLTIQLKSDSSAIMKEVIADIEPFISQFAEYGIKINYAGSGYKSLVFATLLLEGQILSLLLSFLVIALLLTLIFRSILVGIAGTIPIAITAIVNFGTMGLLGIPLSSSTAIISAIAIALGVDYAIHLIEHYRNKKREGLSSSAAVFETLSTTGRAIIYNTIVVMGGFAVLLTSVFPPNRQVGGLIALNLATSAIGTLTILLIVIVHIYNRRSFNQTGSLKR